ncbi:MAG: class I SAM-dependent RNA methyltransferase [Yoonia sp.]|nr:class I SAM-dependent RNA methyltransferase [Yoonia sp.]MDG1862450.1 class I SAM-dependent RNA methyltransferase [Yoonia sp.]
MAMIEGLTHLGLGKVDDGRTLLPRVLPGEEVAVAQDGTVRIITPSADRVAAPCKHFKTCGGCAMQHATDAFVANWKLEIVQKALAAQRIDTVYRDVITSPAQSRRRAKLAGKRTKSGAMLGFHAKGTNTLIPVPECKLLTIGLMSQFPMLEALVVIAASRKAEIALTVTETKNGLDILVETEKPLTPELRAELAVFAQAHNIARLVWVDEPVVTMQPPIQMFGTTAVVPPPGAFLQATKHGETALLSAVEEITAKANRIVDLFAGAGTFTLPLAARAEVHAVEGEAEMIAALDRAWREGKGLKRVTSEARDLFRRPLEPDELRKFDAAVIDPPRAGAEAQIATLAASEIKVIAMVSCNPVTFARDAVTLQKAGFTLDWVQVVDQFRWSAHVEVVGSFTRK